jgi:hypothetical protein
MQIYYTFALFLENSYDLSEISQINSPINCINFYKQSFINMDNKFKLLDPHLKSTFWKNWKDYQCKFSNENNCRAGRYFEEQFRKYQESNRMGPKLKKFLPEKNEFFDISETILKILPIPKGGPRN